MYTSFLEGSGLVFIQYMCVKGIWGWFKIGINWDTDVYNLLWDASISSKERWVINWMNGLK